MPQFILDGHKLAWHQDRVKALLAGERVAPITVDCALTRRCNYDCVYCYSQLQSNPEKPMTGDVIFRLLDDLAEIGVKGVSLVSDGESTCSPHLYDALLRGKANGLDMAMGTNGFLLRDDRLEDILPTLTYLRFNISAGEPARYAEIHGCPEKCFHKVVNTIRECVRIKRERGLHVTIGLQMVLLPNFADQILPLVSLGRELGVDYLVIKHCSDDEEGRLGVAYDGYDQLVDLLRQAETHSTPGYQVTAKWSKILSKGQRTYSRCFGPPLIMQLSGSGLVAPCGMLFNERYSRFHIGNIVDTPFKALWQGERYWEVLRHIASPAFNAKTMCGSLCLQHKVNECLWDMASGRTALPADPGPPPPHHTFI